MYLQELVSLVGVSVRVDDGADQGVVDGIPDLQDDDQQGVPCAQTHDLRPEQCHGALQGETHVAAKVTGGVREAVAHTKLAVTIGIQLGGFLSHVGFPLFFSKCFYSFLFFARFPPENSRKCDSTHIVTRTNLKSE